MNQFHFQDEEALKAQHISDEEARRVIALYVEKQQEQEQQSAQPTVHAMAEGLGIPTEEVLRLLREVRASEIAARAQQVAVTYRPRTRTRIWLVAGVAAVAVFLWLAAFSTGTRLEPATVATVAVPSVDGSAAYNGAGTHYQRDADGSVTLDSPQGHYERHADGSLSITGPEGTYVRNADGSLEIRGSSGYYIRRADGSEVRQGTPPTRITPPTPPPGVSLPDVP